MCVCVCVCVCVSVCVCVCVQGKLNLQCIQLLQAIFQILLEKRWRSSKDTPVESTCRTDSSLWEIRRRKKRRAFLRVFCLQRQTGVSLLSTCRCGGVKIHQESEGMRKSRKTTPEYPHRVLWKVRWKICCSDLGYRCPWTLACELCSRATLFLQVYQLE